MTPTSIAVPTQTDTVCRAFLTTVERCAEQPALRGPNGLVWTWRQYAANAAAAAAGLSELGVGPGDTLACWLSNRPEFHVADTAAMHLGAAPFSVYPTYTAEQAEEVIADSGARVLVTEPQTLERALEVCARGRTSLETVILVDGAAEAGTISWSEVLAAGPSGFDLAAAAARVGSDDLLTLIYTSGTTGAPKGVQLTHGNVMAQLGAMHQRLGLTGDLSAISWLPMAHIAERLCTHYFPMAHGWQVTTCEDPRAIGTLLREVRPEFFFSPPRLWEKLRTGILARGEDGLTDAAAAEAVRAAVGLDRVRLAIVGAAPCPPEVVEFWRALGVPLLEVYGLSETTGVATVNPPEDVRVGTVGTPLDGVEVQLSADGEVLVRGPVVMAGYRNLPEQTAAAIDAEGWLHTGDIGVFDADGYLRIVDRIKELIINAAGKNMSPANIEAALKTSGSLIGQVCCIGDGRAFNTALITLDPEALAAFANTEGLIGLSPLELTQDARVRAAVQVAVDDANARLARVEQIKRFVILPAEWHAGGDELTPTMKLKRKAITAKYAAEIEFMYTSATR